MEEYEIGSYLFSHIAFSYALGGDYGIEQQHS